MSRSLLIKSWTFKGLQGRTWHKGFTYGARCICLGGRWQGLSLGRQGQGGCLGRQGGNVGKGSRRERGAVPLRDDPLALLNKVDYLLLLLLQLLEEHVKVMASRVHGAKATCRMRLIPSAIVDVRTCVLCMMWQRLLSGM